MSIDHTIKPVTAQNFLTVSSLASLLCWFTHYSQEIKFACICRICCPRFVMMTFVVQKNPNVWWSIRGRWKLEGRRDEKFHWFCMYRHLDRHCFTLWNVLWIGWKKFYRWYIFVATIFFSNFFFTISLQFWKKKPPKTKEKQTQKFSSIFRFFLKNLYRKQRQFN